MQSVGEIKEILSSCPVEKLPEVLPEFAADSRKGVQSLVTRFQKNTTLIWQNWNDWKHCSLTNGSATKKALNWWQASTKWAEDPCRSCSGSSGNSAKNCKIPGVNDSKNFLPRNGRSFAKSSRNRQWLGQWAWFPTNALTKSIFCRQLMKLCERLCPNWKYSRTLSLRTR